MEENEIQIPEGWRKVALGKVLRYAQPYRFIVKSTNYDAKSGTPVAFQQQSLRSDWHIISNPKPTHKPNKGSSKPAH